MKSANKWIMVKVISRLHGSDFTGLITKITVYYYDLFNTITLSLCQSDHIIRLSLKEKNVRLFCDIRRNLSFLLFVEKENFFINYSYIHFVFLSNSNLAYMMLTKTPIPLVMSMMVGSSSNCIVVTRWMAT